MTTLIWKKGRREREHNENTVFRAKSASGLVHPAGAELQHCVRLEVFRDKLCWLAGGTATHFVPLKAGQQWRFATADEAKAACQANEDALLRLAETEPCDSV